MSRFPVSSGFATYRYAFEHVERKPEIIQAMLEDLLHRSPMEGFATVEALEESQALAEDRRLSLGVVSALKNYRFSHPGSIPEEIYVSIRRMLVRELQSGASMMPDHRSFCMQVLDFLSGSDRIDDAVFILGIHKSISIEYVPILHAALARLLFACGSGTSRDSARIEEALEQVEQSILGKLSDGEEGKVWRKHLARLRAITQVKKTRISLMREWANRQVLPRVSAARESLNSIRGVISLVLGGSSLLISNMTEGWIKMVIRVFGFMCIIIFILLAVFAAVQMKKPFASAESPTAQKK